ncbi:MAG: hypothetical protein J6W62_04330 [Spirochaetia bacterium]|nr:hypothetical protein [Spirochaetia bacterium]
MLNKKLSDISSIKICSFSLSRSKLQDTYSKWLVCSNFLPDNEINYKYANNNILPEPEWQIHNEDIIIKRITPSYVNYIETIPDMTFAGNNLIIVTPDDSVDAKYLAMILNDKIRNLSNESSIGAVMRSISRSDLEVLEIPCLDIRLQQVLGELWYKSIELKKKKKKLAELEEIRTNYIIDKIFRKSGGR